MHPENLLPLLRVLPLFVLIVIGLGAYLWFERGREKRQRRRRAERAKSYWLAEMAYRARLRAREWLSGTKTRRLTYQGPPLSPEKSAPRKLKRGKQPR